jgi:drug/metabolite transporter (DMT)-like permease
MLEAVRRVGRWGIVLAVLLALAASMFMLALNYASVANVLFMQAASPMVAAALGWLIVGDVVTRRTLIAMLIAVVGVAVMVADSLGGGAAATVLPVLMTASFAGVLVIARHRSDVSMLPATALSQVLIVVAFAPFASFDSATGRDVGILAALGIAQTGIPLAFLTLAARVIPAAEVAILTLLEVVLGPLWVWLAYAERPATATLIGGGIVLVAVVTQALTQDPRARDRPAVT